MGRFIILHMLRQICYNIQHCLLQHDSMGLTTELDLLCCRCSASLPIHLSQLNCLSCHDDVKIVEKH